MGLPSLPFQILTASRQLISGQHINNVNNLLTSFQGAIVALAGGARSGLTPVLNATFCEVVTVASGADSVVLPIAKVGLNITVTNSGANSLQVFANGTDTINGTAGATGVALAAAAVAEFSCTKNGVWRRYVSS